MNKSLLACAIGCVVNSESHAFEKLYTIDVIGVSPRGALELSFGYRLETEPTATPGVVKVVNWQEMPQQEMIAQINVSLERFKQLYETSYHPSNQDARKGHAPFHKRKRPEDF